MMIKTKYILTVFTIVALIFSGSTNANEYVSLNGGFYIDIPDNWEQIDFATVDAFLARSQADLKAYEYETVLAIEGNDQFFRDDYLIITIENIRRMSDKKKDSVLTALGTTYDRRVENGYLDHFMGDPVRDVPVYDTEMKTSAVLRKIFMADKSVKYSLNFTKFTDSGLVNFFFFSPGSKFEESKDQFFKILKSYSTENFREKLPKEEVRVADIEIENESPSESDDSNEGSLSLSKWLAIIGVIAVIIVSVLKRRKSKTEKS